MQSTQESLVEMAIVTHSLIGTSGHWLSWAAVPPRDIIDRAPVPPTSPPPWLVPIAPLFWRAFPHLLKSFTSLKTLHNAPAVGSLCSPPSCTLGSPGGQRWLRWQPPPHLFHLAERLMKPHFFGLRWAKALLKRWMCAGREPPIPTLVCCQEILSTHPAPSRRASSAGRSPRGHGLPPHFTDEGTEA